MSNIKKSRYFVCIDPFSSHLSSTPFRQEFVNSFGYFTVDVDEVSDFIRTCKRDGCPNFNDIDTSIRRLLNIIDGKSLNIFRILVEQDIIYPLSEDEISEFVPKKDMDYSIDYMYQGSIINKYYNVWSNWRRVSINSALDWRNGIEKYTYISATIGQKALDEYFESSLLFHCCISEGSEQKIQEVFYDIKFFLFGTPKYHQEKRKTYLQLYREYVENTKREHAYTF